MQINGWQSALVNKNGIAHVILTVTEYKKSRQFYTSLLPAFGMTLVHDGPDFSYHVGQEPQLASENVIQNFKKNSFNNIK